MYDIIELLFENYWERLDLMFNRLKFCGIEIVYDVVVYIIGLFLILCVIKLVRNIIFVFRLVG